MKTIDPDKLIEVLDKRRKRMKGIDGNFVVPIMDGMIQILIDAIKEATDQ